MLRKYDKKYKNIMVQSIEDKGIGIAIMNRLRKAANKKI
jgi:L-threonylcarbamoyladenylate synthase